MKNLLISAISLALLATATTQSCTNSKASDTKSVLQLRTDTVGKSAEWNQIETMFNKYQLALEQDSTNADARLHLIELYINESRVSGNTSYYNALAMREIEVLLKNKSLTKSVRYQALCYKATVLLSLHQFAMAKKVALEALQLNTTEADIYGSLVDACVELGNYEEAVMYCDKMLSIRPDLRSYSRASYIRELYGENQSAIEAMNMAVDAGAAGMENTEWARVQLGNLYLNKGAIDTAELMYQRALAYRPNYVHAKMGLAKIAEQQGKIDEAITFTKQAIETISESSFISYLAHLYQVKGNVEKSTEISSDVVALLKSAEAESKKAGQQPHNGDRELAEALFANGQMDAALEFALSDSKQRPENIDANELLAKIYFAKNDLIQASAYAEKALKTNRRNKNSLTLFEKIYKASGNQMALVKVQAKLTELEKNS